MEVQNILSAIDAEISRLQQARSLLAGLSSEPMPVTKKPGRGRPKGSKNAVADSGATPAKKTKRNLSPEGRKAIAEAMKRRWAERRKEPVN